MNETNRTIKTFICTFKCNILGSFAKAEPVLEWTCSLQYTCMFCMYVLCMRCVYFTDFTEIL